MPTPTARSLRRVRLDRALTGTLVAALGLFATGLLASNAGAHEAQIPIEGEKIRTKTEGPREDWKFAFKAVGDDVIRASAHDPSVEGVSVLVNGMGPRPSSSGLMELDARRWKEVFDKEGNSRGWRYLDRRGSVGGINKVILKDGKIRVRAEGRRWKWRPRGGHEAVWVSFYLENEQYCAKFSEADGTSVYANEKNHYRALDAVRPGSCPEQLCGNGIVEFGEQCDDGNRDNHDNCTNSCEVGTCEDEDFDSTFDAIQSVIFDGYGCTNEACHGSAMAGDLDLREGASYDELFNAPSAVNPEWTLVFPGEVEKSLLYEKLLAKAEDRAAAVGSPMPIGGQVVIEPHLEALAEWIRVGAPADAPVMGTDELLGTCLPEPVPLKIPEPPAPEDGLGIQLQQTAWDLPANSENEICMATFYDLRNTSLLPEDAKTPCPPWFTQDPDSRGCSNNLTQDCTTDADCAGGFTCIARRGTFPEDTECFAYGGQELVQDPQSHHSIIHIYTGAFGPEHSAWGEWTYKFNDADDPRNGQPCDPRDIDPALGHNPGCSGEFPRTIACTAYGPPDASQLGNVTGGGGGNLPTFSGSQETYYELDYAEGVYNTMPDTGIIVWNSHAFNLTNTDSTMAQYLNLRFAFESQGDQVFPLRGIFDSRYIFAQYVPPFETQEICATTTLPRYSKLFNLSSHMHERGVLWRTWAPPNQQCRPACPEPHPFTIGILRCNPSRPDLPVCDGPRDDDPMYLSTIYNDPLQMDIDPPMFLDSEDPEDRTFLYCARYDNGATSDSPEVKTFSGSPLPPLLGDFPGKPGDIGGPCGVEERACMDGPNKGVECASTNPDLEAAMAEETAFCETKPGANDGLCDACPARGGVTTEDEMFINLGSYYVDPP